jgi:hypothetical protein
MDTDNHISIEIRIAEAIAAGTTLRKICSVLTPAEFRDRHGEDAPLPERCRLAADKIVETHWWNGISAEEKDDFKIQMSADAHSELENEAFMSCLDTPLRPRGILSYKNILRVHTRRRDFLAADALHKMLPLAHAAATSIIANRKTMVAIRHLTTSSGEKVWQPALRLGEPSTLLGRPLYFDDYTPDDILILADFKAAYTIVDYTPIVVVEDPYTYGKGNTRIVVMRSVGGGITDFSTIRIVELDGFLTQNNT